ncbi:MAG: dihydrofolate reductase [Gemmatimonadetes bacterium]|nr:dihydrofolate reductase [Gemmatimonadota bacterium]
MRNLIMWNLVTLDGFFEGPKKWDLGFHEYVWGDELERYAIEQVKSADLLLFGRVTYEGMAAYWPSATGEVAEIMNSIPKLVFSNTLGRAEWNNTRLVRGRAEEEVARLKQQPGKDILVFGSADLSASLMRHGLFDEYRLCMVPVVLGGGTPLFRPGPKRLEMELLDARPLTSGGVILRYRPDGKRD